MKARSTNSDASATAATATVAPLTVSSSPIASQSWRRGSVASIEIPRSLPSWPMIRITATPWM